MKFYYIIVAINVFQTCSFIRVKTQRNKQYGVQVPKRKARWLASQQVMNRQTLRSMLPFVF